ncbi:MAG: S1 RNA-binding domain-containing protein [Thermoguttaceae bacterium]|nr:S1 RNA-binding domain-containing protein [Thermoguttaceae bacterium]MDW8038500.1 S1 RNA-binding domain-containing protein [Thermoguttaceae bacterium]
MSSEYSSPTQPGNGTPASGEGAPVYENQIQALPQTTSESSSSRGGNAVGTGSVSPASGHPQAEAEQPEAAMTSTGATASLEARERDNQETAQDSTLSSEPKRRRILIGSQRDPSLFSQYKPKPNLTVPEARPVRHRPGRRGRGQRQRPTEPNQRPSRPKVPPIPTPSQPLGSTLAATPIAGEPTPPIASQPTPIAAEPPELPPAAEIAMQGSRMGLAESASGLAPPMCMPETGQLALGQGAQKEAPAWAAVSSPSELLPPGELLEEALPSPGPTGPAPLVSTPTLAGELSPAQTLSCATVVPELPPALTVAAGMSSPAIPAPPDLSTDLEATSGKPGGVPAPLEQPALAQHYPPSAPIPQAATETERKQKYPLPSLREQLSEELAAEFQEALAETPVDQLLAESAALAQSSLLEPESHHQGRIVRIHRDEVFVELGGREQGVVPLKQFLQPPEIGQQIEVIVQRFVPEEGLYELSLPASAALVAEWAQLAEGMTVEARVTGCNSGGLECEVGHIRGFIPISMVDLYRVNDPSAYVGQKWICKVIECNPHRGNLVLSRRAVLEEERQRARQQLLSSLAPGQIREGVVRKLMPFGAFVDLGHGVDGLVPISQISWRRIGHPSEILQEGQHVQVVVEKVDQATGRISLSLRQLEEDPWLRVPEKYPPNTMLRGIVRRVVDFGAFVELEPGVEGLVHISELSHKRVWRARDVVQEGQEVEVLVLSVDPAQRRISLSIRQALPPELPPSEPMAEQPQTAESASSQPAPAESACALPTGEQSAQAEPSPVQASPSKPVSPPKKSQEKKPLKLKGGLGPSPRRGNLFGLKW